MPSIDTSDSNPFKPPQPITAEMIDATDEGDPLLSFRAGRAITRATIFLIAMVMLTDLLLLYMAKLGLDHCDRMATGHTPTLQEYWTYIWMRVAAATFSSLCMIGSAICFLVWMHQMYSNLEPLRAKVRRFTPGWAVISWFIPVYNLYKPWQAMIDIWRGSDPNGLESSRRNWAAIVSLWWILWLAKITYSLVVFNESLNPDSLDRMRSACYNQIALSAISASAAAITIYMVWRIGSNQHRRFDKRKAEPEASSL